MAEPRFTVGSAGVRQLHSFVLHYEDYELPADKMESWWEAFEASEYDDAQVFIEEVVLEAEGSEYAC